MQLPSKSNIWLHRYAIVTAIATLGLIAMGGLVTSKGVGMSVPDWPTSYGYNMFALPFSMWFTGGVFQEHTHRQWASIVGVMVVILTRWLGGKKSCTPLMIIAAVELLAGFGMFLLDAEWRGTGGFLSGIGGVVFLSGLVWVKSAPAPKPLPALGWWAFWLVQLQGLLGGLRVVLDAHVFAGAKLGVVFGLFHGCLAQGFFVVLCVIALFTSKWWRPSPLTPLPSDGREGQPSDACKKLGRLFLFATVLISLQLIIGATMRHQHAGLAIPDFPLAYGKIWPETSAEAVMHYNQQRMELTAMHPITSFQIILQMLHRLTAVLIFFAVAMCAWKAWNYRIRGLALIWLGLIVTQIGLGATTIWTDKAADIATFHVVVGALSLVTGALLCIIIFAGHQSNSDPAEVFSSSSTRP